MAIKGGLGWAGDKTSKLLLRSMRLQVVDNLVKIIIQSSFGPSTDLPSLNVRREQSWGGRQSLAIET